MDFGSVIRGRLKELGRGQKDLAVAAESASFAIPGGKGGLFCHTPLGVGARNVGRKRALEMALTGSQIEADRAAAKT